ncbi:MAG: hypothetical protein QGM45_08150 [Anaerolineales bacterium]|nr:hypothetical protein [Anaerolineales bacterium]
MHSRHFLAVVMDRNLADRVTRGGRERPGEMREAYFSARGRVAWIAIETLSLIDEAR